VSAESGKAHKLIGRWPTSVMRPAIFGNLLGLCALGSLGGLAACYDTPRPECGFTCGANGSCPDGYVCGGNDRCRLPSVEDADCPGRADAGPDGPPVDGRIDAPADAPMASCPDLDPAADGTTRQQLSLSELSPTVFVEVFNDTLADLDLTQDGWALAARDQTVLLTAASPAVAPKGYKAFEWPAALLASNAGGELAVYRGIAAPADYDDPTKLVAYACWGTDAQIARKALAETAGKWSGACAPALSMAALRRKPMTPGTGAESYDPTVAAEQTNCAP
jgi:hypothetical protein